MSAQTNTKKERRRILELSSPQSSGRAKPKVHLTPIRKLNAKLTQGKLKNRSFEQNDIEAEIDSNRATCSSGFEEEQFSFFQNVNIDVFYYINNETSKISILISEDKTINELIKTSLNEINKFLLSNGKKFQLDNKNISSYSIREVKKNGLPNYDFPVFNYLTTVQNCAEEKLALTWDDNEKTNIIQDIKDGKPIDNSSKHYQHKKKDLKDPTIKKYRIYHDKTGEVNRDGCRVF